MGIVTHRVQFGKQVVGMRIGEVESTGPRVFIVILTISNYFGDKQLMAMIT
jgi:hypothetical protein